MHSSKDIKEYRDNNIIATLNEAQADAMRHSTHTSSLIQHKQYQANVSKFFQAQTTFDYRAFSHIHCTHI
jgi:hypothetical protein